MCPAIEAGRWQTGGDRRRAPQTLRNVSAVIAHVALEPALGCRIHGLVSCIENVAELGFVVLRRTATISSCGSYIHQFRSEQRPSKARVEQADGLLPLLEQPNKGHLPLNEVDDARESTSDQPASHLAASILREAATTITGESEEKHAEEHHIASHRITSQPLAPLGASSLGNLASLATTQTRAPRQRPSLVLDVAAKGPSPSHNSAADAFAGRRERKAVAATGAEIWPQRSQRRGVESWTSSASAREIPHV